MLDFVSEGRAKSSSWALKANSLTVTNIYQDGTSLQQVVRTSPLEIFQKKLTDFIGNVREGILAQTR